VESSEGATTLADVPARMAELTERLGARVAARLNTERDIRRRVALLSFPAQFASLENRLQTLLHDTFASSRFDRTLLLRGVYFTSGTQAGTPIDRIMAALGREFGFAGQAVSAPPSATRAYFIEKLLRGVVFPESGLAGTHRRLEARKALLQMSAYIGCTALAALAVVWLSVSFAANSRYLREVDGAYANFGASGVAELGPEPPFEEMLAHLDGLREIAEIAERHGAPAPWSMRAGLYQARATGRNARDAYLREVNNYLMPLLSGELRERLSDVSVQPENLFESLKAYLLLHDTERFAGGKQHISAVANAEWLTRYESDPSVPERLGKHLDALFASELLPALPPIDSDLVARSRGSLVGLTPARLVYLRIHREFTADEARALHLDVETGRGSEKVLMRRSGAPLGQPISYVYTRMAFEDISGTEATKAAARFAADAWVFGDRKPSVGEQARLPFEVLDVYEDDYIAAWDRVLADIALKPFTSTADVNAALQILSSPDSPLRAFVRVVTNNTNLVKPGAKGPADALAKMGGAAGALAKKAQAAKKALSGGRPPPGTRTTEHFRSLATAEPAVDKCLGTLTQIQLQLEAASQGFVNSNATAALNQGGSLGLARGLQECATSLPPPLNAIMKQASAASQAMAVSQVRGALGERLSQQVGTDCKDIVQGRYPFVAASGNDVPIADFGRTFGAGGTLDAFFRDNLAQMVDVRGSAWRWREVADAQVSLGPTVLPNFQRAAWIRDAYFAAGGQQPQVRFALRADSLDPDIVRFVLEFDGQRFEYRHDPVQPWSATWPGPAPGTAAVRFEDRTGKGPSQAFQGPWALFRLLAGAEIERRSETQYLLTFRSGGKTARVILEASSIRNPFARDALTQFRCPG